MIDTNAEDIIKELNAIETKYIDRAIRKGIRTTLNQQKKLTKNQLLSVLPKAKKQNPKYIDRLIDAVKVSKIDRDETGQLYGKIHVMGTRKKGSGTYRARFFEDGTKERFAKTYKGKPLKKQRRLGKIEPTFYFKSSTNGLQSRVNDSIDKELKNMIDKLNS